MQYTSYNPLNPPSEYTAYVYPYLCINGSFSMSVVPAINHMKEIILSMRRLHIFPSVDSYEGFVWNGEVVLDKLWPRHVELRFPEGFRRHFFFQTSAEGVLDYGGGGGGGHE